MNSIFRDRLSDRLIEENVYQCQTTPWEIDAWDANDLQSLRIDLESIHQLYYVINSEPNSGKRRHGVFGRMKYNGEFIFFFLRAKSTPIYVSKDASLFMRFINHSTPYNLDHKLEKALMEDGIRMEENPSFKMDRWVNRMDVDSLEEICYDVIFRHQKALEPRFEELPKCIANRIIKFILFHKNSLFLPRLKQHKL